jgi:hypothetical protein
VSHQANRTPAVKSIVSIRSATGFLTHTGIHPRYEAFVV